jgi:hypothetical protein
VGLCQANHILSRSQAFQSPVTQQLVNDLLAVRTDLRRLGTQPFAVTGKKELCLWWQVVFGGKALTGTLSCALVATKR